MIEGIAETTSSLVKIYSGALSDKLRRRKGLTVTGYGIAALATPILLVARSWGLVLLYRFLDRVGKGVRTAPRDALLADSTKPEKRGTAFGIHRAADSAGAFVGLLISIGIVYRLQPGIVQLSEDTFRAIVAWSLVPSFLAVGVIWVGVRETSSRNKGPRKEAHPFQLSIRGLGTPFRRLLIVLVLFTLGNSTDAFLVLRAQSSGATLVEILGMLALFNFVYTFLSGPAGALSDRYGRKKSIIVGWCLYALVYAGFAFSNQQLHFWILYGIYGAYYALTEGVLKALVADTVPSELRGSAYGVFHFAVGIVTFPASLLAGLLWQGLGDWPGFGPAAPFLFGSILAIVSVFLLQFWVPVVDPNTFKRL